MNSRLLIFVLISLMMIEGVVAFAFLTLGNNSELKPLDTAPNAQHVENVMLRVVGEEVREPVYLDRFTEARETLVAGAKEFLEINFSENKVIKYENGIVTQEAEILAKGDPQGWGGTPAGVYKALAKYDAAFSGISEVYMPKAIHFYGKYYLHGEPYYPSGEKLQSSVSGGCIRLEDDNADAIFQSVERGLPILVVDKENDGYEYNVSVPSDAPQVSAKSYLVADVDSGLVFVEKNSLDVRPIASLTKLMTALVVAENVDLRKSVKIQPSMLEAYGETEGLVEGEWFRVVELFYPLLTASSNDAAEAVAGFLGRDRTIEMMNEKAEAILMKDTVFEDPSGYDPKNVSTAQDLFYLIRYVRNNRPPLLNITKGEQVRSFGPVAFLGEELWNKNEFVADTSFEGGKTGYIKLSQHTAAFLFRFVAEDQEVRTVAFVLLGSSDSKADTQALYGWLQKKYGLIPDYKGDASLLTESLLHGS